MAAELRGVPHATVLSLASSFVRNAGVAGNVTGSVRTRVAADGELLMPDGSSFSLRSRRASARWTISPRRARPFPPYARGSGAFGPRRDPERLLHPRNGVQRGVRRPLRSGAAGSRATDVDAVVTVGREVDPSRFGAQPPSIRIRRFVPQEETLRDCDVVINHGGSGSTLGALSFGRPMIVIPLARISC